MQRTRIKFCGLTRPEDVRAAVEAGADAVGFVCYSKSPRFVRLAQLQQLALWVPAFVTPVLLFVNAQAQEVQQALQVLPHAALQFHGDETPEQCRQYARPYLRALRVDAAFDWAGAEQRYADALALLADAPAPGFGGGGTVFDWNLLPGAAQRQRPLVLAGGLAASNVAQAIDQLRPFAVDVSSAIEDAPGQKNAQKMREFAAAVWTAGNQRGRTEMINGHGA